MVEVAECEARGEFECKIVRDRDDSIDIVAAQCVSQRRLRLAEARIASLGLGSDSGFDEDFVATANCVGERPPMSFVGIHSALQAPRALRDRCHRLRSLIARSTFHWRQMANRNGSFASVERA